VLLALPIIIPIIKNIDNLSWSVVSVPYIIFLILALLCIFVLAILITAIVGNFTFIYMFTENSMFWPAFKKSLSFVKREWKNVGLYFLLKIAFGIATGLASLLVIVIVLIPFGIVGFLIALPLIAIGSSGNLALAIAIGATFGIILMIIFLYSVTVVLVPVAAFFTMYAYLFVTGLTLSDSVQKPPQASQG